MKAKKAHGARLTVSYFVTYFTILLVPILVACIFYSESIQVIRTDIENENQALLTQASNILNVRLDELNQIGTQIINNTQVTNLRYVDSPLEYPNIQYFLQVQNVLPDYTFFNDFLFDYVLFFNRGELALNNTEAYTYNDFYDLYMHPANQSKEEWLQELKDAPISFGDCSCWNMVYLRGELPVNKQLLAFSFSFLPFNNGDGQVVLYVDQQTLVELLNTFNLEDGGIAYIETREGEFLAANTQDTVSVTALRETLDPSGSSLENIRQSVDGRDMLISRYYSEKTGFQITIARPTDVLYARVRHLRNLIIFTMLAAFVIGSLASYIFSKRNSRLLWALASSSNSLMGMNYAQAFVSIHQTFEDIQLANHKLEETLAQQKPYLLETFLSQLLNGVFSSEEDAVAMAGSIDATSPDQPMCVVLFHFAAAGLAGDTMESQFAANCKAVIRLSINAREKDALHMNRSDEDYVLLMVGEHLERRINELTQLIRANLPASINSMLFIYVGNTVHQFTEVVRSWDNASSMIYIRPSPAEAPVLTYTEGENAKAGVFYPQDIQRKLINALMNADEREIANLLALLKERNLRGADQPAYMRQLFIDSLLNTLLKTCAMANLSAENADSIRASVHDIMSLPIDQQITEVDTTISQLCHAIAQSRNVKPRLMDEIMAYLQAHYTDAELSLTMVADHFHISESYLSYTFKAISGVNFFSCVETMRMDKAKELLRQTDEKISDIAAKVGYASGNSFCRAFKRRTGNSATAYRNGMEG